jgi:glycosyltransferase involved in cell wall biosynthesis
MEAMELGIPIISTDVGSVKEHVKNNVNGFLIPVDFDVSSVVDIIREISNSFILYNQISVASREHAVEYFDITNFRKRYQKLFE